uniref:Transporter n=1 Tax=Geoglobus ahangari TaxID=113653 RepID=A0A7J3TGB5_9EURY
MVFDFKVFRYTIPFAVVLIIAIINPLLIGALVGSLITSIKASLGCRYGRVGKSGIFSLVLTYISISVLIGFLMDRLLEYVFVLLNYTLIFHGIIACLLIYSGYITSKNFFCHSKDISDKTFLAISLPCPVCIAGTLLSCYFLSQVVNINNFLTGVIVGGIISIGIISFSIGSRENPEKLGDIMIILGIYYIFSILLIPAILQASKIKFNTLSFEISPYSLVLIVPIILGFVKGWYNDS